MAAMPKRALIEQRPWLLASLIAGISFYFVKDSSLPGIQMMAWKGAGVALLAVYALVRHSGTDSRQIAAVMGLGALGDVLIELWLEAGAASFLVGHLIAIHLYWRHRRDVLAASQKLAAVALLVLTPVLGWQLTGNIGVAGYALGLGAMAAAAWSSSFPRYRVGIGAVLFVASDLLIFAELGPMADSAIPGLLIWPLYYVGQFLICTGVIGELRKR
jgi:uncharacterized membrane protein YhhN